MYEAVIGLEVHAQLKTDTKIFCGCSTEFGNQPNSQACPVCLGLPGSLPALNQKAFEYAVKVAIALNCRISEFTKFDRKNYFYPDLPKNYQISQYDLPIGQDGFLNIGSSTSLAAEPERSRRLGLNGGQKRIGIKRVHLEEDAGKLIHEEGASLVDFNRTGIPLLEIVSCPDINSPQEAYDYLVILKQAIRYLGISSCDMEKGILRCDANISVRKKDELVLGTKTELKNMNSFRGVRDALEFELKRQTKLLQSGGSVIQETRLWDIQGQRTCPMRTKEEAQDYRYFPEPDLPPFVIDSRMRREIEKSLPELPRQKEERFMRDYRLSEYDARILTSERELAEFFEDCFKFYPEAKMVANWISGPLLSELNNRKLGIADLKLTPENLSGLIKLFGEGKISNIAAKGVLTEMIDTGETPEAIVGRRNLIQISAGEALDKIIEEAVRENPDSANDYLGGKENAIQYLVGQVMRKSKGKANPKAVSEILKKRLRKD